MRILTDPKAHTMTKVTRKTNPRPCSRKTLEKYPHDCTCRDFTFTAHFQDGHSEVIRQTATRPYENAFFYDDVQNHRLNNIGAYFTLGKKPGRGWQGSQLVTTFKVEEE